MFEKFHHTFSDETAVSLPLSVPFGVLRKLNTAESEVEMMGMLLDAVADEATLAIIDAADGAEVAVMFRDWQTEYAKRAEATMGESVRSVS